MVFGGFLFIAKNNLLEVQAAATDNVYGWAWSENIGWISFNCYNYYGDDINKLEDHCKDSNYGVSIDLSGTGEFSGYAWSENIGWIQLDPEGPYPGDPQHGVKLLIGDSSCNIGSQCPVYGWARALAGMDADNNGGWDGWIKFRKDQSDSNQNYDYGVSIQWGQLGDGGGGDSNINEFLGWAWGSDVLGWISFNCSNSEVCGTSNYKVILNSNITPGQGPSAENLSAQPSWCNVSPGEGLVQFSWTYKDPNDPPQDQSQYHLQVAPGGNFNNTVIDCIVDQSNIPSGDTGTSAVSVVSSAQNVCNDGEEIGGRNLQITFGQNYSWRLKVRNESEIWSDEWFSGLDFTTPDHAYPWVDFTWDPLLPRINQTTQFNDGSTCYDGNTTCKKWIWTIPDWRYDRGYSSSSQNPRGKFIKIGDKDVILQVFDSKTYSCTRQKTVTSRLPLPEWKEIAPF